MSASMAPADASSAVARAGESRGNVAMVARITLTQIRRTRPSQANIQGRATRGFTVASDSFERSRQRPPPMATYRLWYTTSRRARGDSQRTERRDDARCPLPEDGVY